MGGAAAVPSAAAIVVVALALAFLGALVSLHERWPGIFVGIISLVNLLALAWLGKRANAIVESLSSSTESAALDLLSNVVREIEVETFEEPALAALAQRLEG